MTEEEQVRLNRAGHRPQPWPDASPGLTHLRKRFILATLSNGNMALLVNMAKYSALPWDCIFSAELVQAYKPDSRPYQMTINLLGLHSYEVMMVAAHQEDLRAAQAQGMQAAFVPRPLEQGPHHVPDLTPDPTFEVVARSEEHTSELQSHLNLVCRLLLEKKKNRHTDVHTNHTRPV